MQAFTKCILFTLLFFLSIEAVNLENPQQFRSTNGTLFLTLSVDLINTTVNSMLVHTFSFNSSYEAPLLRLHPGDTLYLLVLNNGYPFTNLHFHGLHAPPVAPKDDPFLHINDTHSFRYMLRIPAIQPPGLYWYHSHATGMTEFQTFNGIAGPLIVEGILEPFPSLHGIPEKIILLQDVQIANESIPNPALDLNDTTVIVNGNYQPTLNMTPNELQFWRIANLSPDLYYNVSFSGFEFNILAIDGIRLNGWMPTQWYQLNPSARVEIVVAGPPIGRYSFSSSDQNTGSDGDVYSGRILFFVESSGLSVAPQSLPLDFPQSPDLRERRIDVERDIVFSENSTTFFINNKTYDPDRVDTVVTLGSLEMWNIYNSAAEEHVFHIHQLDFQVVSINQQPQDFIGYRDNVNLPAVDPITEQWSLVQILLDFSNPHIEGNFIYHCHIMQHEDNGMIAVIKVVAPETKKTREVPTASNE